MPLLETIAPSLVSGIFGLFGKKKKETSTINYEALRNEAHKGGFNPLTALKAGGGAGFMQTSQPKLSSFQFIGDAIADGISWWGNKEQRERDEEMERVKLETAQEELRLLKGQKGWKAETFAIPAVTQTMTGSPAQNVQPKMARDPLNPMHARPMARADRLGGEGTVPVYLPDGQLRQIPAKAARSLGKERYSYLNAGEYAELVGELRGEAESALIADKIGGATGIKLLHQDDRGTYQGDERRGDRKRRREN